MYMYVLYVHVCMYARMHICVYAPVYVWCACMRGMFVCTYVHVCMYVRCVWAHDMYVCMSGMYEWYV